MSNSVHTWNHHFTTPCAIPHIHLLHPHVHTIQSSLYTSEAGYLIFRVIPSLPRIQLSSRGYLLVINPRFTIQRYPSTMGPIFHKLPGGFRGRHETPLWKIPRIEAACHSYSKVERDVLYLEGGKHHGILKKGTNIQGTIAFHPFFHIMCWPLLSQLWVSLFKVLTYT